MQINDLVQKQQDILVQSARFSCQYQSLVSIRRSYGSFFFISGNEAAKYNVNNVNSLSFF